MIVDFRYRDDAEFATLCKMFGALAFLPVNEVIEGYEDLCATPAVQALLVELQEFLHYMEYTWVGLPLANGQGRGQPLYALGE